MFYLYFGAYIRFFVYFLDCIPHTYPPPSPTFFWSFWCGISPAQGRLWGLSLDVGLLLPHPQNGWTWRWMVRPLRSKMTMENPSIWRCISCWNLWWIFQCHVSFQRSRCWTKVDLLAVFNTFPACFKSSPNKKKQGFLIFPQIPQRRKTLRKFLTHYHWLSWIWAEKKNIYSTGRPPSDANPLLNEDLTDFWILKCMEMMKRKRWESSASLRRFLQKTGKIAS